MKKLILLPLALFTAMSYADDPVYTSALIDATYFIADRDPTPTEPVVATDMTFGGKYDLNEMSSLFWWYNSTSHRIFDYTGGEEGNLIWVERGGSAS